jgi:hypothetical protein
MCDFLCFLGPERIDWAWAKEWLRESKERRIVFVNAGEDPLEHPQIQWKSLESPLQIELLAKEIAWVSVFMKMEIRGGEGEFYGRFKQQLEKIHLAANLLLSDAADRGVSVARHAFARGERPVRQGMQLKGAFKNIPAIIVGGGPSLEKNGHLLQDLQTKALIFAGGRALNLLQIEPHFAAAIDAIAPYSEFKKLPFPKAPFCFQSRMNVENFSSIQGEAILFPDSHYRFLDEGEPFEGGWTVGTFLTAIATFMGCDPILFVGMDYCYNEGRKYAGGEVMGSANLVETTAQDGRKVWTQPDWLMAKSWMEEWAASHPAQRFINATEGGIGFAPPIGEVALAKVELEVRDRLRKRVEERVAKLPNAAPMDWQAWRKSLERCNGHSPDFEGERAYERLLQPLWQIWRPLFQRALTFDPHPDKLEINRLLFFQQTIQEHLLATE